MQKRTNYLRKLPTSEAGFTCAHSPPILSAPNIVKKKSPKIFAVIAILSRLCLAPANGADEFWVAPNGNDCNPGTLQKPFASIARAEQKIRRSRELSKLSSNRPMKIILRGGSYPIAQSLVLDANDSGIEIEAATNEVPVLRGGVEIRDWKRLNKKISGLPEIAKGNVWVADAPGMNGKNLEFRQLWVNDKKAVRARAPNGGNMFRLVAWNKINQVATIPANALEGIKKPKQLEMIIDQVWEIADLRVKNFQFKGPNLAVTFKQPESRIEFQHPWPPVIVNSNYAAPFFLVNAIQFLDSPGEWFEDLRAGKVYYWPRAGEDLPNAKVIAPVLETLVRISGTLDAPASNIQFRGITFANSTWLRPSKQGHVPLQAGMFLLDAKKLPKVGQASSLSRERASASIDFQKNHPATSSSQAGRMPALLHRQAAKNPKLDNVAWIGRPAAAVEVKNANHISFENCTFENLASAGLDFSTGTHDDLVQGCIFRNIGGNGIQLGKFSDTNVETHVPWNPSDEREICAREKISNNIFSDCADEDWGCVGIAVGYAREIKIEHNEISDLPYTGISVGWGWTKMTNVLRDNFIFANRIHDIGKKLGDLGGIYLLSAQPGTIVAENSVFDIHPGKFVPDPKHWFYLYADEGSSFETWRDNWTPSEKFLRNANGPGNVWTNNGPMVSEKIKNAAGLEPAFQRLQHDE